MHTECLMVVKWCLGKPALLCSNNDMIANDIVKANPGLPRVPYLDIQSPTWLKPQRRQVGRAPESTTVDTRAASRMLRMTFAAVEDIQGGSQAGRVSRDTCVVFSSHSSCQCQVDQLATTLASNTVRATPAHLPGKVFTDGCNHQTSQRGGNMQAFSCHGLAFTRGGMRTNLRDQ